MSFNDLHNLAKQALSSHDRLVFLDTNVFRPPIFPFSIIPIKPHPSHHNNPDYMPSDILNYLDARVKERDFNPFVNELLRQTASYYFDFLFKDIMTHKSVRFARINLIEVAECIRSGKKTAFRAAKSGKETYKCNLETKSRILGELESRLKKIDLRKIIDHSLMEESKAYKEKTGAGAGIADIELFINALRQANKEKKDVEIWTRDRDFVKLASRYALSREGIADAPHIYVRRPFMIFGKSASESEEMKRMSFSIAYDPRISG